MKLDVKELALSPLGTSEKMSLDLYGEDLGEGVKAEKIRGILKLAKIDHGLVSKFEGKAKIKLECDRCLEGFDFQIILNFDQEYVDENQPNDDDKLKISKDLKIDISEPIRQEILVQIPVKKLCSEDCKGLCPKCGKNQNSDKCECQKVTGH